MTSASGGLKLLSEWDAGLSASMQPGQPEGSRSLCQAAGSRKAQCYAVTSVDDDRPAYLRKCYDKHGGADGLYAPTVPSNIDDIYVPGMGDATSDDCGSDNRFTYTLVCSKDASHSRQIVGGVSCGKPECPICYTTWLNRAADRIGCRVDGFRQFDRFPPKHVILSLSDDETSKFDLDNTPAETIVKKLRSLFKKKAAAIGCHGGAMVIHLWRTTSDVPRDLAIKKWEYVRKAGRDKFHDLTYFSPHAHIAGYGYLQRIEKGASDFLYVNKGNLATRDDIERWAYYAMSHSPVIEGKKGVIYFGSLGYSKLKPIWKSTMSCSLRCPVCGAEMVIEGSDELWLYPKTVAEYQIVVTSDTVGCDPPKNEGVKND